MKKITGILLTFLISFAFIFGCVDDPSNPRKPYENKNDFTTQKVVSTLPRIEVTNGEIMIFLSVTDQIGNPIIGLNRLNFQVSMDDDIIDNNLLNSTGGTGTPHNISTALTLDYSGSMHVDSADIPNMENAVHTFINLKGTSDIMEVIKHDHVVQLIQPFTSNGILLNAAVDDTTYTFGGATAFYQACLNGLVDTHDTIATLTGWLPSVVGFTDGKNNQQPIQPDTLISLALQYQIPLYTVAYGSFAGQNAPDTAALQFLADTTGGRYFFTPTSAGLQTLYQYINGQLTNAYVITFPFGNKENATIKVTTTYKCGNGTLTSTASKMIWY